ncbi:MAG TPA: sigma-70 family RNA polymerase sigma factor [Chloroflexota bacterium]|nr:sigma-70 family RNA polymerase sigma factor [Chloroflexota bacterium]
MIAASLAAGDQQFPEIDTDRALVEAAQQDPSEFAGIYTRYARRVFLYVRSRVSTEEDAVDITQQVFVKSFQALPKYRPSAAPISAWLFRIARNACIDHQRRSRPATPIDAVAAVLRAPDHGPEEEALRTEDVERLRRALSGLDVAKRDLLALRYAGNLRIKEIAKTTGRSEEATKKQLSRALKTLRQQYDAIS